MSEESEAKHEQAERLQSNADEVLREFEEVRVSDLAFDHETVYESKLIGLRWNHTGAEPVLEMHICERFQRVTNNSAEGGVRERWEPVPDFNGEGEA